MRPIVIAAAVATWASPALADSPRPERAPKIAWQHRRFDAVDWIVTGAGAAAALGGSILPPPKSATGGGMLFDDGVRSALRPGSAGLRVAARDTSDFLLQSSVAYPLLVDTLVVAKWHHGSDDVAWQMALIDAEALALATGVQAMTSSLVGRARPYSADCGGDLSSANNDCQSNSRYRSYFSGHTTIAFTAASLTCVHHAYLPLYGGAADTLACVGSLAAAAATGTLRIVSDQHYATDVLTGALVGAAIGIAVPLLHYGGGVRAPNVGLDVRIVPSVGGATVVANF